MIQREDAAFSDQQKRLSFVIVLATFPVPPEFETEA